MSTPLAIALGWIAVIGLILLLVRGAVRSSASADELGEHEYGARMRLGPSASPTGMRGPRFAGLRSGVVKPPVDMPIALMPLANVEAPHEIPHEVQNPMQPGEAVVGSWRGLPIVDIHGARLGNVERVLVDPENGVPWLLMPMTRDAWTLVPARNASSSDGRVQIAYERGVVADGPRAATVDCYRDGAFRSQCYRHYGLIGLPRINRAAPSTAVGTPAA